MEKITGNIADLFKRRVFPGEIVIEDGVISSIKETGKTYDHFIIPGFVDSHVHIESSMLLPTEFARLAVCHGTVGTVSDPHEIGNVLGIEGVRFMIENGLKSPLKFYFGAPSCVPATPFETAGATIDLDDLREILSWKDVNYLAEMMDFPGVISEKPGVMEKINLAHQLGKEIDGHAPGIRGEDSRKYVSAGISTDHECFTKEEALDKLKYGMKISIREGSAAKNFEALWSLIDEYPEDVMLCSDDKHPDDLVRGHINLLARRAVEKGCDIFNILRCASLNPIKHYDMNIGLVREGDPADFCMVDNLQKFNVLSTFLGGNKVAENGKTFLSSVKEKPINNFKASPISPSQIKIKDEGSGVKVIVVEDGQLVTRETEARLPVHEGNLQPDTGQDILKLIVLNRYEKAPPSVAFIKNTGINEGAIASSVAHDSHNIIAAGTNDEDICRAVNLIVESRGGVSLAKGNNEQLVPLPVAGLMSEQEGYKVARAYEQIDAGAKKLGSTLKSPYMTLSFCALLVIPELKLSDKGLFDGNRFDFTSVHKTKSSTD